jgi:DNA-nicking Smr family endonuclease
LAGDSEKKTDPLTAWLRINGVYDKDREDPYIQTPAEKRRELVAKRPDAVFDLHGLTRDEAWSALETFFYHSHSRGLRKILIIHGKGNHSEGDGILKRMVKQFIETCPFAGESGHGSIKSGGNGSTWVLLKDSDTTPDTD